MARSNNVLVASSRNEFLARFGLAFSSAGMSVSKASDGYEALTLLERGSYDMMLADAGVIGIDPGLNGISSDELSHMWRQIEGRGSRLVIGIVSCRSPQVAGSSLSRFSLDPVLIVKSRGADHHFWEDEPDATIINEILQHNMEIRQSVAETANASPEKIVRMDQKS